MSQFATSVAAWLPPAGVELCRHRLAIALRFVDPFIDPALPAPPPLFRRGAVDDRFIVRIDSLDWTARRAAGDGTYRFSVSNPREDVPWQAAVIFGQPRPPEFPTVPVTLQVQVLAAEPARARYHVPGPIAIDLPVQGPTATPLEQLTTYLREIEAYPTPLFRAPAGETCVRGVVRDPTAGGAPRAGVEVAVHDHVNPPANATFVRTDANGFFAYRLPWLKRPTPVPDFPSLGVTVRPPGGAPFGIVRPAPHPAADVTRALFTYGTTTSIIVEAS